MKLKLEKREIISISVSNDLEVDTRKSREWLSFFNESKLKLTEILMQTLDAEKASKLIKSRNSGKEIKVKADLDDGRTMNGVFYLASLEVAGDFCTPSIVTARLESTGEITFTEKVPEYDRVTVKSYAEVTTSHDADLLDYVSVNGVIFYRGEE